MPDAIPDLWPEEVEVTQVLTPRAILGYQAGQLKKRTKNLLEAEVVAERGEEEGQDLVYLHFDLIAPALQRYRFRLFTASHREHLVYPVWVSGECFDDLVPTEHKKANTEREFIQLIGQALHSKSTKSVIQSLIARSNDEQSRTRPA